MTVKNTSLVALLICCSIIFCSCTGIDVFEKNISIPKHSWQYTLQPRFDFNITDTVSEYNLYIVLRHTDAYVYNNIWLNIGLQSPGDTMRYQRLEVKLGSDEKGWEGTGLDDIWEIRRSITNGPLKFNKAGNYSFSISQIMRENPLQNIMNVGIRIEKAK